MTYQLIVSTMDQLDYSLLDRMNINSDAIIINQTYRVAYREIKRRGHIVKWYDFNERGVGLSRNSGLMRADADIVQFADDDMVLTDTYARDVAAEYEKHPKADVILVSNICLNTYRIPYQVKKFGRIGRLEAVNFGGARITARREKLLYNNISFSLLFGGGARYGSGEDTTFIQDCVKSGMTVCKSPLIVSRMDQSSSCWLRGYNEKYFRDKGALLAANFPLIGRLGVYFLAARKIKYSDISYRQMVGLYKSGMKEFYDNRR